MMSSNSCLTLTQQPLHFFRVKTPSPFRTRTQSLTFSARLGDNSPSDRSNPQLNLSVLRFTLGIPGLDESYLPRWIGYGFGSLLVLNHFFGSNDITSTQLRTEALGISLAGFSISLPYLGKFIKGATRMDQTVIAEGSEQVFVISEDVSDTRKEDLAWATYVSLRNTNTVAVLISVQSELCARGYWNTPMGISKSDLLNWFALQIEKTGLSEVKSTLYFSQISDSGLWEMLPKGTKSVVVQPLTEDVTDSAENSQGKIEGFVLLASTISYGYSDKDRAWIGALAKKFGGQTA